MTLPRKGALTGPKTQEAREETKGRGSLWKERGREGREDGCQSPSPGTRPPDSKGGLSVPVGGKDEDAAQSYKGLQGLGQAALERALSIGQE